MKLEILFEETAYDAQKKLYKFAKDNNINFDKLGQYKSSIYYLKNIDPEVKKKYMILLRTYRLLLVKEIKLFLAKFPEIDKESIHSRDSDENYAQTNEKSLSTYISFKFKGYPKKYEIRLSDHKAATNDIFVGDFDIRDQFNEYTRQKIKKNLEIIYSKLTGNVKNKTQAQVVSKQFTPRTIEKKVYNKPENKKVTTKESYFKPYKMMVRSSDLVKKDNWTSKEAYEKLISKYGSYKYEDRIPFSAQKFPNEEVEKIYNNRLVFSALTFLDSTIRYIKSQFGELVDPNSFVTNYDFSHPTKELINKLNYDKLLKIEVEFKLRKSVNEDAMGVIIFNNAQGDTLARVGVSKKNPNVIFYNPIVTSYFSGAAQNTINYFINKLRNLKK